MIEQKQVATKKFQPHFPTTKIKKIIQENQQIGKLSNLVPPLIEQSLQYFLIDLIKKAEQFSNQNGISKLTPAVLKKALANLDHYTFMKDALDDVEDLTVQTLVKLKYTKPAVKRSKPQGQGTEEVKKGKKKVKLQDGEGEEPNESK